MSEAFIRNLERASRVVATWPEWKRGLLGRPNVSEKIDHIEKLEIIYVESSGKILIGEVPKDTEGVVICEMYDHAGVEDTAQRIVDLWNSDADARLATATELLKEISKLKCPMCYSAKYHVHDCRLAAFLEGCK